MIKGKPFVKCAVGKKSVIDKLIKYSPEEFDTYYELFRNEGNLLFELMSKKAVINDYNDELMNVYRCIKNEEEFSLMCKELNKHETYHSDTSTFNCYTENGFGKDEQRRLAKVFKEVDKRGCYVMLSNYNTELVMELYDGYNFYYIEAQRNVGAFAKNRGVVEEVIITNYDTEK